jgi:diketogulonate reductase-like aldo/keto reductase
MSGSSIHAHYTFEQAQSVTPHLRMGQVRMQNIELLEAGRTVPIVSGQSCIHSLFHLDTPSVTVVVRTQNDPGMNPQFNYLPPHMAVDPMFHDTLTMRRKQLLDLLEQMQVPGYAALVLKMVEELDFERGFYLLQHCMGALSDLVRQGKIQAIGLSEVSASTLRKAHAVHPIAALQTEYSLWTRNPEIAVLQACRELGVAFVAFSPVARGFLCGAALDVSGFDAKDIRRSMPRFTPENYAANLKLLPAYHALAQEAGCTSAQLALAWLLQQGEDIIPIPGTTSVEHLLDDLAAADVKLDAELMARLDALINQRTVAGDRYNAQANSEVDTEVFG